MVCGDDVLALGLVQELTVRFDENVTVILRSKKAGLGPRIAALSHVRIVEADQPDEAAFRDAHVETARALAFVAQDDVGNLHAALRAQDLYPGLRMVIRIFQSSLRSRVRTLLPDSAVLSAAALSAPPFVAAALGQPAPRHVRLPGHTLYVARRRDTPAERALCAVAEGGYPPRLLPGGPLTGDGADAADTDTDTDTDTVLAVADGAVGDAPARGSVRRLLDRIWVLRSHLSGLVDRKLRYAFMALVGLLVLGTVLFATRGGYGWSNAIYLILLDAGGSADAETGMSAVNKLTQLMVNIVGILLLPVIVGAVVDAVVSARLAKTLGRPRGSIRGHVVVVGLGEVGTRVVMQLHDLGIPMVCVERGETAAGVPLARRLGVPIVYGDATDEDTLRAAHAGTARALVAVTSDDVMNLETALQGRELRDDMRVVLRMFDDEFASRVEHSFGMTVSRSVESLAAPSFAAAMIERQVVGMLRVADRELLIADVAVEPASQLEHRTVGDVHQAGEARVIGLRRDEWTVDWNLDDAQVLGSADRLIVIATRTGLGSVLGQSITEATGVAGARAD